ncbi:lasso peptide biosynthesis B2 protein [Bacillus paramycoides]|uniref:Microcin J25-processing protein McjB C-terminal domain-containing protein n=1 Tax=Bacillus paramycoides TaxID=2026194 RepID=A0A1J9VEH6_9BACI|nr:lasso peptide biosynthesis B2 protein [Bacillus paramycoides]OJD73996.1 hypothetical protein BAU28_18465 [Bacillus paramycoides]
MIFSKAIWHIKIYFLIKNIDNQLQKNGFKFVYDTYFTNNKAGVTKLRDLTSEELEFIEMIIDLIEKICLNFYGNTRCLHKSIAGYQIFSTKNLPIDLVIGVMKKPFTAHAWLEFNKQVLNDFPENLEGLQVQLHTRKENKVN